MKNIYKNSTEEELVNGLKSLEVKPPIGLWDDIEATLESKRRRKIFIISSWASAATVALLISIGGIYMMNSKTEIAKTQNLINKNKNIPSNNSATTYHNATNEKQANSTQPQAIEKKNNLADSYTQRSINPIIANSTTDSLIEIDRAEEIPGTINSIHISNVKLMEAKHEVIDLDEIQNIENSSTIVVASVDLNENKQKGVWLFTASGFPVYSFHTAGAIKQSGFGTEQGIVAWGASVSIQHSISTRYFFETGVTYNTLGQQEKNIYLVSSSTGGYAIKGLNNFANSYGTLTVANANIRVLGNDGVNSLDAGVFNSSNFNRVNALQKFSYLEIPLLLGKAFKLQNLNLKVKVGLVAGFLISNQLDLSGVYQKLKGKTIGVDPIIASTQASIGLSFPIAHRVNLIVEPTFRLGLNSLNTNARKSYPFATYVKFGIEIPF